MLLTKEESTHWAKYYSKPYQEYIDYDDFWNSLYDAYKGKNVPLPLLPDTQTIWKVLKRFKCDPNCGKCCHYKTVALRTYDIKRMIEHGIDTGKCMQQEPNGGVNLISIDGNCPFLADNKCSIYEYRPETCYLFPLQCNDPQQLSIRLLCKPALDLARNVVIDAMKEGTRILLPDLTIIQAL